MKEFKNDTRSATKNFINDTYRTVGYKTDGYHILRQDVVVNEVY